MGPLPIQASVDIASSTQDESVEVAYHRPADVKEQPKGIVLYEELQGIVALQQGQEWATAGKTSRLQAGMCGWCSPTVARPGPLAKRAPRDRDADARPAAPR